MVGSKSGDDYFSMGLIISNRPNIGGLIGEKCLT